jgi:hypothetical protein
VAYAGVARLRNNEEKPMEYCIKIIGHVAYVSRKGFMHAKLAFPNRDALLCTRKSHISVADCRELSSFVASLPGRLDALNRQIKRSRARYRDRPIECSFGENYISLPPAADAGKIIPRFAVLLAKIEPLIELAEVIWTQIQRKPLKTNPTVKFFGCEEVIIDGMPVKQWLAIRKKAALKIDPETAEVDWKYAQMDDPYGVYGEVPEECYQVGQEYFVRAPGSDVWVWSGDLPEATERALWNMRKSK